MDAIQSAIAKKEILDGLRPISPEQEQRIMQKFRLDWNYHSNHIEGNSLSYGETKALLLFNITAQGKPLKDHFEIKGHNEAIDWVLDVIKNQGELTEHFIRQMHEVLLKEPYMSDAMTADGKPTRKRIEVGKYKTLPNHVKTVTGEIFYFASPEETPAKMHDLLQWYHEKKQREETNPILLAAEFHYRFVRIHPFDDGNGRMARMLMNFILMQYSYPPVIIRTEDKKNYISALEQADTVSITPFIEYIAQNLDRSLDIMIAGAKGESIEEPDDLDKEMMLLEQEINNTNRKVVFKTQERVKEILEMFHHRVYDKFDALVKQKLQNYYKRTIVTLIVDNTGIDLSDSVNIKRYKAKTDTVGHHAWHYHFSEILPFPTFTLAIKEKINWVEIRFQIATYHLANQNGDKIIKYYDEDLTDEEIDTVIKKEVIHHMKFIAQKIKEAEDTNKS
jgi:Fic family protein